jgi:ubiquinone/menaquinone biosynthesis C-methylase UbiE
VSVSQTQERQPHAILDRDSRRLKARKIARLVERARPLGGARVLDIGAGSGHIASNLGALVGDGDVWAVDVNDQRRTTDGYSFKRVSGTALPFDADSFDVVLSNHVIEHVGERSAQLDHLQEIKRVLAPDGVCYLAVPSRWVLVEPHFRLPLLSWVPQRLRDPYVRAARRGSHYDCNLPTRGQVARLFSEAGFEHEEVTIPAMRVLSELEALSRPVRLLCSAPDPVLRMLLPLNPTMIFLLRAGSTDR